MRPLGTPQCSRNKNRVVQFTHITYSFTGANERACMSVFQTVASCQATVGGWQWCLPSRVIHVCREQEYSAFAMTFRRLGDSCALGQLSRSKFRRCYAEQEIQPHTVCFRAHVSCVAETLNFEHLWDSIFLLWPGKSWVKHKTLFPPSSN